MAEREDVLRQQADSSPVPERVDSERQSMPLRQEELVALKRMEQSGEVEIRKERVTENRTFEVPVTRETVVVERRSAEEVEPVSDTDPDEHPEIRRLQPGERITIPVVEEEVVVEKRPVVTEEVVVGKRLIEETHNVSETVRREEPVLETHGGGRVHGSIESSSTGAQPGVVRQVPRAVDVAERRSPWPVVAGWSLAGVGAGLIAGWLRRRAGGK